MPKCKRFIIVDWAGNLIDSPEFKTFDDGWHWLYTELFPAIGLSEDGYQDYYVEEKRTVRELTFLDPNDPRKGYRHV